MDNFKCNFEHWFINKIYYFQQIHNFRHKCNCSNREDKEKKKSKNLKNNSLL